MHFHPLLIIFFLCLTARCTTSLISIAPTSFIPNFHVVFESLQLLFTERYTFITGDKTCPKAYQDKKANSDLCGNENQSFHLVVTDMFECEHHLHE